MGRLIEGLLNPAVLSGGDVQAIVHLNEQREGVAKVMQRRGIVPFLGQGVVNQSESLEVPAQGVGQHARDVTAHGLASLDRIRDGVGLGNADLERYTPSSPACRVAPPVFGTCVAMSIAANAMSAVPARRLTVPLNISVLPGVSASRHGEERHLHAVLTPDA